MKPGLQSGARKAGFTLVELALVIFIVGIMLSLVVPRLPDISESRLDHAARRLAAQMAYLYDEAALRGRIYRLRLDLDRESYDISVLLPFAARAGDGPGFRRAWDPYAQPVELPAGVEIASLSRPEGASYSGEQSIYFLPEGSAEGLTLRLANSDGDGIDIALPGLGAAPKLIRDGDEQ